MVVTGYSRMTVASPSDERERPVMRTPSSVARRIAS